MKIEEKIRKKVAEEISKNDSTTIQEYVNKINEKIRKKERLKLSEIIVMKYLREKGYIRWSE